MPALYLIGLVVTLPIYYASYLATLQTLFPSIRSKSDVLVCLGLGALTSVIWPVGWMIILILGDWKHGLQFFPKPPTEDR